MATELKHKVVKGVAWSTVEKVLSALLQLAVSLVLLNLLSPEDYGLMAIVAAFIAPVTTFLATIPACVMGGVCVTLYGFIAVSGLKMIQKVDLEENANLFTVSVILITGIGGMSLAIGKVVITAIACALILGILVNTLLNKFKKIEVVLNGDESVEASEEAAPTENE